MKYFTIQELCKSSTADKLGIDNSPYELIEEHLQDMVDNLLDPLREAWGGPIRVTSGYRCGKLNSAIGGSPTSSHQWGYAVDLQPVTGSVNHFARFVFKWLKDNNIPFDQFIIENDAWVHLGYKYRDGRQRGQYLKAKKNKKGKWCYETIKYQNQI